MIDPEVFFSKTGDKILFTVIVFGITTPKKASNRTNLLLTIGPITPFFSNSLREPFYGPYAVDHHSEKSVSS